MSKPYKLVFKYWYRSVLNDNPNSVWCESSDLEEVVRMSKGYDTTLYRMTVWLVHDPWKPMSKKKVKKLLARMDDYRRSRVN